MNTMQPPRHTNTIIQSHIVFPYIVLQHYYYGLWGVKVPVAIYAHQPLCFLSTTVPPIHIHMGMGKEEVDLYWLTVWIRGM